MGRIVLSEVAKNSAVVKTKKVKPCNSEKYMTLVKEADRRINAERVNCVNVYKKAATYLAR